MSDMNTSKLVWRIAIFLIVVAGIVYYSTGYVADLPMVEMKDERHNLDEIYILRGLKNDSLWKPGYPPGILYVYYGAQLLVEQNTGGSAWEHSCLVINYVRTASIFANLLTLVTTALLGRKLGGNLAGITAAVAWLVAPLVLQWNQFGFPQVYEGLFYLLTVYLAILAVEQKKPHWALASTLVGLGAILFKYTLFPALGAGVGAALWLLRDDRRRWSWVLALQFVAIILTAIALVTLGGAGSLMESGHRETTIFLEGGLSKLGNLSEVARFLGQAAQQIGLSLPVLLIMLAIGILAYWSSATTWQRLGLLTATGLSLIHPLFMVTYFKGNVLYRNVLTDSSLLTVAITVSVFAIGRWLGRRTQRSALTFVSVAGFLGIWLVPQLEAGWQWIHFRSKPITYSAMVQWVNQNLPEEKLLVSDYRPFDSEFSCENYSRPSHTKQDITEKPLTEWLDEGFYYAQLSQENVNDLQSTPEGLAYLEQMTLLKQFPPPEEEALWRNWRYGSGSEAIAVYRLWSATPTEETEIVLGEQIRLLGYDLTTEAIAPGDTLTIRFYWQPTQPLNTDYHVFVHLVSEDTPDIITQSDGVPSRSELRPTSTWHDTNEVFISQQFEINIPNTLPPQTYQLLVGLYNWHTGERLATETGKSAIEIPITVSLKD